MGVVVRMSEFFLDPPLSKPPIVFHPFINLKKYSKTLSSIKSLRVLFFVDWSPTLHNL